MTGAPKELKDKKSICLFGFGKTNQGLLNYLSPLGFSFSLREDGRTEITDVRINRHLYGALALSDITEDVILFSPSVKRDRKELKEAQARGTLLTSDSEMFFGNAASPIFSVSGSDGKSTTTELAERILRINHERVLKSGNCGAAMTPSLAYEAGGVHIVELSSFMLEYFTPKSFSCVMTSLSENHLDWHGTRESYFAAKRRLFKGALHKALHFDTDAYEILKDYRPTTLISARDTERTLLANGATHTVTLRCGAIYLDGKRVLSTEALPIKEDYNIRNLMSAIALSAPVTDPEGIFDAVKDFKGLSHRRELVGRALGIDFIDSSIDSSPSRCAVTLTGLSRRVTLLLGGRTKGLSVEPMIEPIARFADAVITFGEAAEEYAKALLESDSVRTAGVKIKSFSCLDDAFFEAVRITPRGGCVLLSPAATSYDCFKNFEERGDHFKALTEKIQDK